MADTITVSSELFSDGQPIPTSAAHQMGGGDNVSPPLSWSGVPDGTRSVAVTCYDPDAPTTVGFVHWVVFNLDPSVTSLPAGAGSGDLPGGAVAGYTDYGMSGYGGMAPPPGDEPHRYEFRVYALDTTLDLDSSATYAYFRFSIRGHVLAEGSLTGTYAVQES